MSVGLDLGPLPSSSKSPSLEFDSGDSLVSPESSLLVELRLKTVSDLGLPTISKSSLDYSNEYIRLAPIYNNYSRLTRRVTNVLA